MARRSLPGRITWRHVPRRRAVLIVLALALAGCNLTAAPTAAPPPVESVPGESRLVVSWIDGGSLVVWRSGDAQPRRIAAGSVVRSLLSPAGTHVAFTRGPAGSALSLWVVDVDGVAERELIGPDRLNAGGEQVEFTRHIGQVAWLDETTLLFNTIFVMTVPAPGGGKADDLWRADLDSGQVTRVLPDGQGGDFAISPDGSRLALVTPGGYAGAPGLIRLVDAQGQAVTDLLSFDAPATASEYAFYPRLHWLPDSSALLTAIPDPDLIYPTLPGETPRTAALWRLDTAGESREINRVAANFFGLPRWSPSGAWLTYLAQVGRVEDNTLALVLARGDGSEPEQLRTGAAGALEPAAWHPTEDFFTFTAGAPGEMWLARPGMAAARFPPGGEPVFALAWADATTAIIASAPGGEYSLWIVGLNDPTPASLAVVSGGYPSINARHSP